MNQSQNIPRFNSFNTEASLNTPENTASSLLNPEEYASVQDITWRGNAIAKTRLEVADES